jgi:hypothetical protein
MIIRTNLMAVVLALVLGGCGVVNTLTGGGSKTVANLWPDVPAMDGMTKVDADLPLPIRLAVQGLMRTQTTGGNNDMRLDNFEVVIFNTPKTPADVGAFYNKERMTPQGWKVPDGPACLGDATVGSFCFFNKKTGTQDNMLIIGSAREDGKANTVVYFLRVDGTAKK